MSSSIGTNINYFQPTGFRVLIDRKNYGNLEFFVQSINHPGATCPAVETPFSRIASVPMPGSSIEYSDLSMQVLLDEDMNSYTEVYDWLLRTVNEDMITKRDNFSGKTSTTPNYADITIVALSSHNNASVKFKYVDALPTAVGDITFEAQNQSVEYVAFPVSFRFSYFEIIK